jgi:hypothetical protein
MGVREALAYLSGVILGDGWFTHQLALTCKDRDFAEAFANAIHDAFGINLPPRPEIRATGTFWCVRRGNRRGRFDALRQFHSSSLGEKALWLRGLFDSEGNAQFGRTQGGPHCYQRRIAIYSTNRKTLNVAAQYLADLHIPSVIRTANTGVGHKGSRTVYELRVIGGRANLTRFGLNVGSSIARKCYSMLAMVISYRPDFAAHCRAAQLKGAATKLQRTMSRVIPAVVDAIHQRAAAGEPIDQRTCSRTIPQYNTARGHLKHNELVFSSGGALYVV